MKEKIPEIVVKIGDKTYTTNHQKELEIARETIDEDMMKHASLYGWYAVLEEMLEDIVSDKKLNLAVLEAGLYDKHRKLTIKDGGKATDKAIDSKVKQDKEYIDAFFMLSESKKNRGIFHAISKSFEHRRDMLINLGAKFRKEMDGNVLIKKEEKKMAYR